MLAAEVAQNAVSFLRRMLRSKFRPQIARPDPYRRLRKGIAISALQPNSPLNVRTVQEVSQSRLAPPELKLLEELPPPHGPGS